MEVIENVIPTDNSTLFVCSGMQNLKHRFSNPDKSTHSTVQKCIRTNDLDSIGDGTHLSSFDMIGNFSFYGIPYRVSYKMWLDILLELGIVPDYITYHPDKPDHFKIWQDLGWTPVPSEECVWSDGVFGGYCCEMFKAGVEIGNLVNTLDHSTDVGFGLERIMLFVESKTRVDETSLFEQSYDPVTRDHVRTIEILDKNGIVPGYKGRQQIMRKLIRKCLTLNSLDTFDGLTSYRHFVSEFDKREKALENARSCIIKNRNRPYEWWKENFGLEKEEIVGLKIEYKDVLETYTNYLGI